MRTVTRGREPRRLALTKPVFRHYTISMLRPGFVIREMRIEDYEQVCALWKATPGIGLSEADSRETIASFLRQNPGLSFVALTDGRPDEGSADGSAGGLVGRLVGALLGSQDGRRGYLHHLAVTSDRRCQGIGRQLVERSLAGMRARGLRKCHIFVFAENVEARRFWRRVGWFERGELIIMSRQVSPVAPP